MIQLSSYSFYGFLYEISGDLGSTHQEDMVKDLSGAIHLTQNGNHLIVDKLLELSQVACHMHFQLCADL